MPRDRRCARCQHEQWEPYHAASFFSVGRERRQVVVTGIPALRCGVCGNVWGPTKTWEAARKLAVATPPNRPVVEYTRLKAVRD